jgi:hypothetical protein
VSLIKKLILSVIGVIVLTIVIADLCKASTDDTNEFVTGVLAVPFKWHLSDKSVTLGSTIGGYLGYQTKTWHDLTLTPIVGGGLALIDQSTPTTQAPLGTGVTVAFGMIGRVGTFGTQGVQIGIIFGRDWLGQGAKYKYEGKPWIAFEVGYNFSL